MKSISNETTFQRRTNPPAELAGRSPCGANGAKSGGTAQKAKEPLAGRVGCFFKLKRADFRWITRRVSLYDPTPSLARPRKIYRQLHAGFVLISAATPGPFRTSGNVGAISDLQRPLMGRHGGWILGWTPMPPCRRGPGAEQGEPDGHRNPVSGTRPIVKGRAGCAEIKISAAQRQVFRPDTRRFFTHINAASSRFLDHPRIAIRTHNDSRS